MTCTNWRNPCILVWPTVPVCWIWDQNFTDSKWWNSFNDGQTTPNLYKNLSGNVTFDKWWNSYICESRAA